MENVWINLASKILSHIRMRGLIPLKAAGKVLCVTGVHFHFKTMQTHMFIQDGNQGLLVRKCLNDHIGIHQYRVEETLRAIIVSRKIETRIGAETVAGVRK